MHAQHGSHTLACDGAILVFHGYGPWNDVAIATYQRDLERLVPLLPPRWAFLGYFHGEALLTPDAERALVKVVRWRGDNGMHAMAIVTGEATALPIVLAQLSRVYDAANIPFRRFDTGDEAMRWLVDAGYKTATVTNG